MRMTMLGPLKRLLHYGDGYRNPIVKMRVRGHKLLLRHTLFAAILLSALQATCLMNIIVVRPELLSVVLNMAVSGFLLVVVIPVIVSLAAFGQTQRFTESDMFELLQLSNLPTRQIVRGVGFTILHWTRDLLIVPVSILPLLAVGNMVGLFNFSLLAGLNSYNAPLLTAATIEEVLTYGYITVIWGVGMWGIYIGGLWYGVGLGFRLDKVSSGLALITSTFLSLYLAFIASVLLLPNTLVVTIVFCVVGWGLAVVGFVFCSRSLEQANA